MCRSGAVSWFRLTTLLWVLCTLASPLALSSEIWIVNEGSEDIAIIDSDVDEVVGRISLATDDVDSPRPWGIAFSTIPGLAGDFAFVTQGRFVTVIDAASRQILRRVDVGSLLGGRVTLKGCAAARPERFLTWAQVGVDPDQPGGDEEVWRTYLHVAGSMESTLGVIVPLFVVLDQTALLDPAPAIDPLVGFGPLVDSRVAGDLDGTQEPAAPGTPSEQIQGEAIDVVVMGAPAGRQRQRAWYSVSLLPSSAGEPARLGAALLVKPPELSSPWRVANLRAVDLPMGMRAPRNLGVAAPLDRELPLCSGGPSGAIHQLDEWRPSTPLANIVVAVAVAGPGPGSYTLLAVDHAALTPIDCTTTIGDSDVGPLDVAILGRIIPDRAYVVNHDNDTVTLYSLRGINGLPHRERSILLDQQGATTPCMQCPVSIAVQTSSMDSCSIHDLTVETEDGGDAVLHWEAEGCHEFTVWCNCLDFGGECGCHPPPQPPFPTYTQLQIYLWSIHPDVREPGRTVMDNAVCRPSDGTGPHGDSSWHPLGSTIDRSFTHTGGSGVMYTVTPRYPLDSTP